MRAVARIPAKVRTKLLVAFLVIAALLVVIALLGLRVLGQSNSRAERLGALQLRVAGYQDLEADAAALRQLLALCTGTPDYEKFLNGGRPTPGSAATCLRSIRQPVDAMLALLGSATQLGFKPATERGCRVPPAREGLRGAEGDRREDLALERAVLLRCTRARKRLSVDLEVAARSLAEAASNKTNALIAQNRSSYTSSRNLFIAVGAGSIVLALLLGFVLSLVADRADPATEARLAEIAAGDFSSTSRCRTATSSARWPRT